MCQGRDFNRRGRGSLAVQAVTAPMSGQRRQLRARAMFDHESTGLRFRGKNGEVSERESHADCVQIQSSYPKFAYLRPLRGRRGLALASSRAIMRAVRAALGKCYCQAAESNPPQVTKEG